MNYVWAILYALLLGYATAVEIKTCTTVGPVCTSCTEISICSGIGQLPQNSFQCPISTPFCNQDACNTKPAKNCNQSIPALPGDFMCMTEGTIPNPTSCDSYYICVNKVAYKYDCEVGQTFYSSSTKTCSKKYQPGQCTPVECQNSQGQFRAYPTDRSIYVFCSEGYPSIVYQCQLGYVFDENLITCIPGCKEEGRFPDKSSDDAFIECTTLMNTNSIIPVLRKCPAGSIYNERFKDCLSSGQPAPSPNNPSTPGIIPSTPSTSYTTIFPPPTSWRPYLNAG